MCLFTMVNPWPGRTNRVNTRRYCSPKNARGETSSLFKSSFAYPGAVEHRLVVDVIVDAASMQDAPSIFVEGQWQPIVHGKLGHFGRPLHINVCLVAVHLRPCVLKTQTSDKVRSTLTDVRDAAQRSGGI